MNNAAAFQPEHIMVTVGSDDMQAEFFTLDQSGEAFSAAKVRSLTVPAGLQVKAIEKCAGYSTISVFQNGEAIDCFTIEN